MLPMAHTETHSLFMQLPLYYSLVTPTASYHPSRTACIDPNHSQQFAMHLKGNAKKEVLCRQYAVNGIALTVMHMQGGSTCHSGCTGRASEATTAGSSKLWSDATTCEVCTQKVRGFAHHLVINPLDRSRLELDLYLSVGFAVENFHNLGPGGCGINFRGGATEIKFSLGCPVVAVNILDGDPTILLK